MFRKLFSNLLSLFILVLVTSSCHKLDNEDYKNAKLDVVELNVSKGNRIINLDGSDSIKFNATKGFYFIVGFSKLINKSISKKIFSVLDTEDNTKDLTLPSSSARISNYSEYFPNKKDFEDVLKGTIEATVIKDVNGKVVDKELNDEGYAYINVNEDSTLADLYVSKTSLECEIGKKYIIQSIEENTDKYTPVVDGYGNKLKFSFFVNCVEDVDFPKAIFAQLPTPKQDTVIEVYFDELLNPNLKSKKLNKSDFRIISEDINGELSKLSDDEIKDIVIFPKLKKIEIWVTRKIIKTKEDNNATISYKYTSGPTISDTQENPLLSFGIPVPLKINLNPEGEFIIDSIVANSKTSILVYFNRKFDIETKNSFVNSDLDIELNETNNILDPSKYETKLVDSDNNIDWIEITLLEDNIFKPGQEITPVSSAPLPGSGSAKIAIISRIKPKKELSSRDGYITKGYTNQWFIINRYGF